MDATVAVEAVRDVGPATVAVVFRSPPEFDAQPGQFVRLTAEVAGEEVSRFYTVSSPDTRETFETTVGLDGGDEGPDFAGYLAGLESGAEVAMSGPFGEDYYEGESRAVILAEGPGVGPAVAVAERALAAGNEASVVYRTDAPAHTDRLEALRENGVAVRVTEVPLDEVIDGVVTGAAGERAFVYGFAGFVEEAVDALASVGVDTDDAKIENFG